MGGDEHELNRVRATLALFVADVSGDPKGQSPTKPCPPTHRFSPRDSRWPVWILALDQTHRRTPRQRHPLPYDQVTTKRLGTLVPVEPARAAGVARAHHATAVPSSSTIRVGIASRATPSIVVAGATPAAPNRAASTP